MSGSGKLRAWAHVLLKLLSGLLTISLLAQFFIAGMSSVTNPDWWAYHKVWVGMFQWLVLPLPVFAWLCGKPRGRRVVVTSLPILQLHCNTFLCTARLKAGYRAASDCTL